MLLLETFLRCDVLALEARTWTRLMSLMEIEARGTRIGEAEIAARLNAAIGRSTPSRAASSSGSVAVIPAMGLLFHRGGFLSSLLGWRSTTDIARDVRAAAEAPGVAEILLEIDSPGGEVGGVEELAATIANAAGRKRVTAAINTVAGSAAYWIASAASEVTITPSGQAGGIGVIATHEDLSAMAERLGVRTTFVTAGRFKSEGNMFEALGPEARSALQAKVDTYYRVFVDAVARGRRVTADTVRSSFGEGRMVLARDAVARRMADRIATFDQTLARVLAGSASRSGVSASSFDADLDRRRRRFNLQLQHVALPPLVDVKDLDRRRRRHRLAEATRR
jgi:signal peptide peptidase SppA